MSQRPFLSIITVAACAFAVACGSSAGNENRSPASNTASNTPSRTPLPATPPAATPVATPTPANSADATPKATSSPQAERPRVVDEKKSAKTAPAPSDAIPSEDEMRKAFSKPVTKDDVNNPSMMRSTPMMKAKPADQPMMKSNRKLGGKPQP